MSYPIGTLDLVKIQDSIYDWVKDNTQGYFEEPVQIIWRNQSEPLPPRPCVTLKFISGPSPTDRDPSVLLRDANNPIVAGMQMEAVLSIQIFGNTKIHRPMAYQLGVDLNSSLLSAQARLGLKQGGVSIQKLGAVQNMTALEESEYEERSGFELELGLVQNIIDQSTTIKKVNISGSADGHNLPPQSITLP